MKLIQEKDLNDQLETEKVALERQVLCVFVPVYILCVFFVLFIWRVTLLDSTAALRDLWDSPLEIKLDQ